MRTHTPAQSLCTVCPECAAGHALPSYEQRQLFTCRSLLIETPALKLALAALTVANQSPQFPLKHLLHAGEVPTRNVALHTPSPFLALIHSLQTKRHTYLVSFTLSLHFQTEACAVWIVYNAIVTLGLGNVSVMGGGMEGCFVLPYVKGMCYVLYR